MSALNVASDSAEFTSANAKSSLYIPDRSNLILEGFFRTGRVLRNTANRALPHSQVAAPTVGALSAVVSTGVSGYDTNIIPNFPDVTVAAILKRPSFGTDAGMVLTPSPYLGLRWQTGNFLFHNTQTGAGVATIAAPVTADFIFVIGWGSAAGHGFVRYGEAGALVAAAEGSVNGVSRNAANTIRVGATSFNSGALTFEIAWAACFPRLLTDAEQLALYLRARVEAGIEGYAVH